MAEKRVKSGVDEKLEEAADLILAAYRKNIKKHSDKKDYFTTAQLDYRRAREIYNKNGFPEAGLYQGLFKRCYNPLIRSRSREVEDE